MGLRPFNFGLHSLKAGGATAAANAKVPHRLFKRHKHWRSEVAKDGNVKNAVQSRLEVSRSLGLYPCYNASFLTLEIVIKVAKRSGGTTQWFVACVGVSNVWCGSV